MVTLSLQLVGYKFMMAMKQGHPRSQGFLSSHTDWAVPAQSEGKSALGSRMGAGCEAAIYAMRTIFEEENTEAILLIYAANAFNSINRNVFLHNINIIYPAIPIYVHFTIIIIIQIICNRRF